MDPITIGLGLQGVSALVGALGGAKQQDPEKIYQKRLNEAMAFLANAFKGEEMAARRDFTRDTSTARRIGARQAAQLGVVGDAAVFTAPGEAALSQRLENALYNIRSQKAGSMFQLKAAGINAPIVMKPNALQTVSTIAGTAGNVLGAYGAMNPGADPNADFEMMLRKSVDTPSAIKYLNGQTTLGGRMTQAEGQGFTNSAGIFDLNKATKNLYNPRPLPLAFSSPRGGLI